MRKNHTPALIKRIQRWLNCWYIEQYIRPQFNTLGKAPGILSPRTVQITGEHINVGNYLHLISNRSQPVMLTSWSSKQHRGEIHVGHYCLISPGVNIASAESVRIGNNCMLAADVLISDCDWHGIYNRVRPFRCSAPVNLGDNVWVGARAIIGKGVSIGENSIIGAGAVVVNNIPANVIAAGNPAKIVKMLNSERRMLKREFLFRHDHNYWQKQHQIEDLFNTQNTFSHWLRVLIAPSRED